MYTRRAPMNVTDREKELIKAMIDRGEPLPPRYRLSLFADAPVVELIGAGKTSEVTSALLPFQSIEQIDEPRQETNKVEQIGSAAGLFNVNAGGRQSGGWSNKLIWGDNKLMRSSLKKAGQAVKIRKDKKTLAVSREVLTKKWTDGIDYRAGGLRLCQPPGDHPRTEKGKAGKEPERAVATGWFIFENEWQSFRTRKDRTLELTSEPREYDMGGKCKVAVKVIDIFGNDTAKVIEVRV